ncbi:MAG TPA: hypothetical protein PLC61_07810 [Chitinophagales bacterium]|nr:hypothetical protein [Chitinophagales bacterium]MCO5112364.1 hypothetical protein [Burkholderiaceae bacterium]MCO5261196.1 hypothetical protein [Crocinitomicaceae bacterium]MCO5282259.1 hypothetical protein [Saprospiraceae bacterium]HMZ94899.1 hypothetical protein [Chitinophagales bacterium]
MKSILTLFFGIHIIMYFSCDHQKVTSKDYYPDGSLFSETEIIITEKGNNVKNGKYLEYLPDGSKVELKTFLNDTLNGPHIKWYPNGEKKLEENYVYGKLEGKRINYKYGKISSEQMYKNGQLNGVSKSYFSNGQLYSESNYLNGVNHGVSKKFTNSGLLFAEDYYENGTLVEDKSPIKSLVFNSDQANKMFVEYNKIITSIIGNETNNLQNVNLELSELSLKIFEALRGSDEYDVWNEYHRKTQLLITR